MALGIVIAVIEMELSMTLWERKDEAKHGGGRLLFPIRLKTDFKCRLKGRILFRIFFFCLLKNF